VVLGSNSFYKSQIGDGKWFLHRHLGFVEIMVKEIVVQVIFHLAKAGIDA
jgi:hypothetical protein